MLHSANFLRTSAQPRLVSPRCVRAYNGLHADFVQLYKPWELRDEEEDRIDDQINEAKAQIERELASSDSTQASRDSTNGGGTYKCLRGCLVLRSHILGPNDTASEEKAQIDGVTDAGSTTAEPAHPSDLPSDNKATATESADGTNEASAVNQDDDEAAKHSSSKADNLVTGESSEEARETSATNQDEHDDHVVEGEEDTVIY